MTNITIPCEYHRAWLHAHPDLAMRIYGCNSLPIWPTTPATSGEDNSMAELMNTRRERHCGLTHWCNFWMQKGGNLGWSGGGGIQEEQVWGNGREGNWQWLLAHTRLYLSKTCPLHVPRSGCIHAWFAHAMVTASVWWDMGLYVWKLDCKFSGSKSSQYPLKYSPFPAKL